MSQTNSWEDKFWHYRVHERLGETLFYFLARVHPLDSKEVVKRLEGLFAERQLGSVRVFPIFGLYDFLIRAWLHPSIANQFRGWLGSSLRGSSHTVHTFSVNRIDKRWYSDREIDRDLLGDLDNEDTISAVQAGESPALLQKLLDKGVVLTRPQASNINFFVAINLEEGSDALHDEVLALIKSEFLHNTTDIKNTSIYRGFGFCSILFKGQVENFFNIAQLPNWIGERFKAFGATTETYLVHGPTHVIGGEEIGQATFLALMGRDIFVQAIIPELYDSSSPKRSSVEDFLINEARKRQLTQKDKKLLHDYLVGYLADDPTQMAKTLFTFFYELESYLRDNHKEFIGRKTQQPVNELYKKANIEEGKKYPSLGDVLHLYSLAIKLTDQGEDELLTGDWEDLAKLRNEVMHGGVDILSDWNELLKRLLKYLPRVRQLLPLIEGITKKAYSGSY